MRESAAHAQDFLVRSAPSLTGMTHCLFHGCSTATVFSAAVPGVRAVVCVLAADSSLPDTGEPVGATPGGWCEHWGMRSDDFFNEDSFGLGGSCWFDQQLMTQLRAGPIVDRSDIEVAVPLARLAHDELERYGTDSGQILGEEDIRAALLALNAVVGRLGVTGFELPFRDYGSFRNYWIRKGAKGSWQARRDLLRQAFEPLHDQLADLEAQALSSTLATPISPHARTGWAAVDTEISELRRHFMGARTPQDYSAVGNDCVRVTEALSRQVYDATRHLRAGEEEPPVDKTKQRLGRFVEDAASGGDNERIRKLAVAAIEMAQSVKHSGTPTRREAGVAADAVILLANILRRLDEDQ